MEEINLISRHEIGRHFFGDRPPTSISEFRRRVPVTTYDDFASFLVGKQEQFPTAHVWAHTSGRSGQVKWIPYTKDAYFRFGEHMLAQVILGAAREKGDVRLEEGDKLVYNTPPRPYISGIALRAIADQFNFRFIPGLEETESMGFQERISMSFDTALDTGLMCGIDCLGAGEDGRAFLRKRPISQNYQEHASSQGDYPLVEGFFAQQDRTPAHASQRSVED